MSAQAALRDRPPGARPWTARELDDVADPFYRVYACADGRSVYLVAPAHAGHQARCLEAVLGEAKLPVADPYAVNGARHGLGGTRSTASPEARRALAAALEAAFATRTADRWTSILADARVPAAPVQTVDEWRASAHARDAGLCVDGACGRLAWLRETELAAPAAPVERAASSSSSSSSPRLRPLGRSGHAPRAPFWHMWPLW
jgi:crotonobetainyl-CoA:carnitine CoA-transferase CaiB-like acyl-CoA transferase